MRKTTFLTLAFVCLTIFANAQISKGSLFLGGSVSYGKSTSETTVPSLTNPVQENKSNGWNFLPQVGVAVGDNRIVGLYLNLSNNEIETRSGNNRIINESASTGGGIFYRRYYPLSQRFFLFGNGALGVNFSNGETTNDNGTVRYVSSKSKSTAFNFALTPGFSFAATRKLHLEAALNNLFVVGFGSNENTSYDLRGNTLETIKGNSFSATANANVFSDIAIGLRWILPRKK